MYQEHFGLNRLPFQITPDADFFYPGGERAAILKGLVYSASHNDGIVKVIGEIGSGKSLLCRMLADGLPDNFSAIFLANPNLRGDSLVNALLGDLGETSASSGNEPSIQRLQNYLLNQHRADKQTVLLIEEAQAIPESTLEELRLLTNLETSTTKLLRMFLFAQPELDITLKRHHLRQFRDRITQNFYLRAMRVDETEEYLGHRLRIAGYTATPLFTGPLVRQLHTASGGRLRPLNVLADKMLLAAYVDGVTTLTDSHFARAAGEYLQADSHTGEEPAAAQPASWPRPLQPGKIDDVYSRHSVDTVGHGRLNWPDVSRFLLDETLKAIRATYQAARTSLQRLANFSGTLIERLMKH